MGNLIIGCGYLGVRAAALWRAQGKGVSALGRNRARTAELDRLQVQRPPAPCDVTDAAGVRAYLETVPAADTLFYAVGFDRGAAKSMRQVYVDGLANVLDAVKAPKRFVYISSTGVYGQCDGEEVDETAATEPMEESGRVVWAAEQMLRGRLPQAIILRFAGIYGPGRLLRRQAIEAGETIVGDAEKWLNLIHVEDGAAAVLAAETKGRPGQTYNVSDDCPVRRRDFYTLLAQALHAPEVRFVLPEPGAAVPPHERANRRIVSRRLREELGLELRYPSYREGLPAAIA